MRIEKSPYAALLIAAASVFAVGCSNAGAANWDLATLQNDHQGLAFSSNLPVLIVETNGKAVFTEPKVPALMKIIDSWCGPNALAAMDAHDYFAIGIETRGFSSQKFPKKSFGFETRNSAGGDKNVSLLGLPKQSDWALHGPYTDKTLMRNHIAYWLSNEMGFDAPRTEFVELFMNEEGKGVISDQYWGVYLLTEKVKRGENRVELKKLTPEDKTEPKITGGYLLNLDRHPLRGFDCIYYPAPKGKDPCVRLIYPKFKKATKEQKAWIAAYLSKFARAVESRSGYEEYIDTQSVIDGLLVHELIRNPDGLRHSTFMHKDRGHKLELGPLWDCDLCMGNVSYHKNSGATGWCLEASENAVPDEVPIWWRSILGDEKFARRLVARWRELRESRIVTVARVVGKIEETRQLLSEAQSRNFKRWPILGVRVRFNPEPFLDTWEQEVQRLKNWMSTRIQWMDAHIEEYPKKKAQAPQPDDSSRQRP